jgi:hypothetical protein
MLLSLCFTIIVEGGVVGVQQQPLLLYEKVKGKGKPLPSIQSLLNFDINIIRKTKNDAQEWLRNLSVGKDDYIDEYRQRIMELNEQRRDLWEVVRKYENQPFIQIAAPRRFMLLQNLYYSYNETLPIILNNDNNTNTLSGLIYEDTTSLYPEVSV